MGMPRKTIRVQLPRGITDAKARRGKDSKRAMVNSDADATGNGGGLCGTDVKLLDEDAGGDGGAVWRAGGGGGGGGGAGLGDSRWRRSARWKESSAEGEKSKGTAQSVRWMTRPAHGLGESGEAKGGAWSWQIMGERRPIGRPRHQAR
jgi:hypothetical protein